VTCPPPSFGPVVGCEALVGGDVGGVVGGDVGVVGGEEGDEALCQVHPMALRQEAGVVRSEH
jgi:hypothetical protein